MTQKRYEKTYQSKIKSLGFILFGAVIVLLFLGIMSDLLKTYPVSDRENILFEEPVDAIREIIIDYKFAKKVIMNPPKRGILVITRDSYGDNDSTIIRIEILER